MNKTLRSIRTGFLSAMLVMVAIFSLTAGASAHSVSVSHHASASLAGGASVNIVKQGGSYNWTKHRISVHQGENATLCNKTTVKQVIQYSGFDIYTIPANTCKSQKVSFSPGTYTVNLKLNPKAKLTIIVK